MLERILLEGLSAAHSFGDSQKILFSNLDLTEPEGSTPVRLALDERGPLNQRLNWCLLTLEKLHINAIWLEVRTHLHLIDLARDNRANSCESLQWLSIGILSTRRINDDPVTLTHTLYGRFLSMVQLDETALDASLDVRSRNNTDPKIVRGHVATAL